MKIKGHKDGYLIGDSIDVECIHPIAHHGKCKALKSMKYHKQYCLKIITFFILFTINFEFENC